MFKKIKQKLNEIETILFNKNPYLKNGVLYVIDELINKIRILEESLDIVNQHQKFLTNTLVKCDTCGCLLEKTDAIRGKSTVEKVTYMYGINEYVYPTRPMKPQDEIIVEHYYCKVHGKGKK